MGNVIFVRNEQESKEVQKKLFGYGFQWRGSGDYIVSHTYAPFLVINEEKYLKFCRNFEFMVNQHIVSEGLTPLSAESVINNPLLVDGVNPPEKMIEIDGKEYSESTIKAALREYVK